MSNDNVTYLLEGHPYFCFRKKWKKRYCVIVKRSSISMHCLSRLSLLLICTNSVFCTTFDDFDELQLWAQTLERSLIRCRFFATACYAAKASNLRVHMSHPINRLSFKFSAPGLNRPLSKLRTSFEGVHRASPSFSLQSLRELFHRHLNSHAPDIAKNGVVGEEAFCDGCLHVTQDRLCFVLMPSDGQPTLLASWLFDSGNLLAYGTGRFVMPLPPSTPNQQLVTEAAKSCRLAFYLISSTRMRNAPGLHIFVCDQAAEVSQWIQRATRPTCLLHERRWVTSIVSQLGSPSLRSPLSSTSWRQRCFSDPIASISNDQSRAWTTLGPSPNPRRDVDHNGPWGEQHTRSVTQDLSEDHGNCPSLATRNPPAGLNHPTNPAADSEFLLSPPYHATKSSSSLFGDPLGLSPKRGRTSVSSKVIGKQTCTIVNFIILAFYTHIHIQQIRRYKDTLKSSLKRLQINPTNWEELARDRLTWRRTVKTGAAIYEANRIAAAKAKREARKSQLRPIRNAAAQTLPTCPRCQRTFRARIGLVGHLRTNCTSRTAPAIVPPPASSSPSLPPTNSDTPSAPPLPSSSFSSTAPAEAVQAAVSHITNPDTTTDITTHTSPDSSDEDLDYTCPHCDRTFTSHIGLVGHLRIHRTETGEPVPGAPTYTHRTRLHCPHCPRTFRHRMGLFGHMRIHESGIDHNSDTATTSNTSTPRPILAPPSHAPTTTSTNTTASSTADTDTANLSCPHCPRTFTSRIGLVGHLRIHRTETGEPVPGAPTYTHRTRLRCPHCPRTFTHRMGLFGHMRIHDDLR
nr:unnamed protein product [Spirometra erinaceieuropaei]